MCAGEAEQFNLIL